jgi:Mg/Co/Ni transporter MgtE
LAQGVLPPRLIRRLQSFIPPHFIRWEHCSILEADPQRRLRLNISNKLLEKMHPADLADIVEDLTPEDREAIFETIDSEVAAETLSEVEPEIQASILESLETEKAADIVEEMAPHEAADVLAELGQQTSEDILEEMEQEPKTEVQELLEYKENSAGGLMNTEFVALPEDATVADAIEKLKEHEDILEKLNTLFLVDSEERLQGSVPLARLFTAPGATPLKDLAVENQISVDVEEKQDRITETFDKYNLLALPVVDENGKLAGAITADEVISLLRHR